MGGGGRSLPPGKGHTSDHTQHSAGRGPAGGLQGGEEEGRPGEGQAK